MFLAKHGVLDSLTKVLTKIQENNPENPMEVSLIDVNCCYRFMMTSSFVLPVLERKSLDFAFSARHDS